jgi:hypothetical protein
MAENKENSEQIKELCLVLKEKLGRDPKAVRKAAKELTYSSVERMAQDQLERDLDELRHDLGLLDGTPLGDAAVTRRREKLDA